MKTIELSVYSFDELSEESKEKVINEFRENNYKNDFIWISEVNASFKKFAEIFDIKWSVIDYTEPYRNEYSLVFDDDILALTGHRLAKYIWNNYRDRLYKGKYYSLLSRTELSYKHYKKGFPVLKYRYSKIFKSNTCVLTGVSYDDDVLRPIYEFLDNPKDNIDFETLLNNCIYSLCHAVSSEIEYQNSDEGIINDIQENAYEFDENGNMV